MSLFKFNNRIHTLLFLLFILLPTYLYSLNYIWKEKVDAVDILVLLLFLPFIEFMGLMMLSAVFYLISKGILSIFFVFDINKPNNPIHGMELILIMFILLDYILFFITGDIVLSVVNSPIALAD